MKVSSKKNIFNLFLIILFLILSIVVSLYHEPWADEAQAWLIARDTSVYTLIIKYLHTDGHPCLWHLIIKIFQLFGLTYKYFFIIPIIFSTIGVALFTFKSNYKWYIKLLFSFSFFVFYQYTVVIRGYCLLLMLLSLLAIMWDKRFEKPILFSILLIFLMNSESYIYFFSVMIYLDYIYTCIKEKNFNKKLVICLVILFIFFCLTVLYMYPYKSFTMKHFGSSYFMSDSFFTNYRFSTIIKNIATLLLLFIIFMAYKGKYDKFIQYIFFIFPIVAFSTFYYSNIWHFGIVFIVSIIIFWIHGMERNHFILALLIPTLCIHLYYTFSSVKYDFSNTYCAASEVADFIKMYDYKNLEIYGLSYSENAINAYFDSNIFSNWDQDKAFFYLSTENIFYIYDYTEEFLIENDIDIIIISALYNDLNSDILNNYYDIYSFDGASYLEDFVYEDQTYTVFVNKNLES